MSVLIKGMKMPHNCSDCDYAHVSMFYHCIQNNMGHRDCAYVELPEKHGRLIDADALIAEWNDVLKTDGISPMFAMVLEGAIRDVERAKVIVEAEGEE